MKAAVFSSLLLLCCNTADDPGATADDVVNVSVADTAFSPTSITVKVGGTVRWTWTGGTHNVTSGDTCGATDNNFRSALQSGGTFEHKFETAGTFPYYCEVHCGMGMKGQVVVQ